jgi:hypothetical protein
MEVLGLEALGGNYFKAIWSTCGVVQKIALLVIPIGIMAQVGVSILSHLTGRENQWNLSKVLGSIVIFFFVVSFQPIIKSIDGTIDSIEGFLRSSGQMTVDKSFEKALDLRYNDQKTYNDAKKSIERGDSTGLQKLSDLKDKEEGFGVKQFVSKLPEMAGFFTISIPHLLLNMVSDGVTGLIRVILFYMQIFLLSAVIIIGPLAAMMTTIPIIGDNILKHWFKTFLNFKCWGITCAVLDILMDSYLEVGLISNSPFGGITDAATSHFGAATVANICFIILFIMVPKITSWYIGGFSDSGASAMIGAATTIATVASGGAALGGAVATGGMKGGASMIGAMMGGGGGGAVQQAQMMKVFTDLSKSINTMNQQKNNP